VLQREELRADQLGTAHELQDRDDVRAEKHNKSKKMAGRCAEVAVIRRHSML